jgi:uncharacterized membrane-anchored protein
MNWDQTNSLSWWRFLAPLTLQTLLIIAIPAQAIYTHLTGKTVILQTAPVDPYDLLRGYSQTLSYEISNTETLKQLDGWNDLIQQTDSQDKNNLPSGTKFYVILQSPDSGEEKHPLPWTPVAVSTQIPSNLPVNRVALQGENKYGTVNYGLETYYMPEDQREKINGEIRKLQQQSREQAKFLVEIKVDSWGNAVPVSLWLGDRNYRF